jgi:hypothetical protein
MARMAIGGLMIDVDVPDEWDCEYTLSGSLRAEAESGADSVEISALTIGADEAGNPDPGLRWLERRAAESGTKLDRVGARIAVMREDDSFLAGFEDHVIIATLECRDEARAQVEPVVRSILSSVACSHGPFDDSSAELAIAPLMRSHDRWFEAMRLSLRAAMGWDRPGLVDLAALDDYWASLVESPALAEDIVNRALNAVAVELGDHLVASGFRWSVVRDRWGTSLAVVALPGTGNVVVVPESFVGKRWESRIDRFLDEGVQGILAHLAEVAKMHLAN